MDEAEPDVPPCMSSPAQHPVKVNFINLLERLNGESKSRVEAV